MIVDRESFLDMAVRLKLISEGLLQSAVALRRVGDTGEGDTTHWQEAVDGMAKSLINVEYIEKLMTALIHAQDETAESVLSS